MSIKDTFKMLTRPGEYVAKAVASQMLAVQQGWTRLVGGKPDGELADPFKNEAYVYGSAYLIASTISRLPVKVYRYKRDTDGKEVKDYIPNHPFNQLLEKPNFYQSQSDVLEWLAANYALTGKMYLNLGEPKGQPKMLQVLNSGQVSMGLKQYNDDKPIAIEKWSDIIDHFKFGKQEFQTDQVVFEYAYGTDSFFGGQSALEAGRHTIETSINARIANKNIFKNGMITDIALESDKAMPPKDINERLKADNAEKFHGSNNAHKVLYLWEGLKYKNVGMSQRDTEFIAGLKMNAVEICGCLFQVPIILLGVLDNSSYNNIREATKIFYNFAIKPRCAKIEELLQRVLQRFPGAEGMYVEFDFSQVPELKDDLSGKVDQFTRLVGNGVPYNEAVELLELPLEQVEGGDVGYMPFSLQPVFGKVPEKPDTEPPEPPKTVRVVSGKHKCHCKVKQLDKAALVEFWKGFAAQTGHIENQYKVALKDYFYDQMSEVLRNLRKYKAYGYQQVDKGVFVIYGVTNADVKEPINPSESLFNLDTWIHKYAGLSRRFQGQALAANGRYQWDVFDLGNTGARTATGMITKTVFDEHSARAQAYITQKAFKFAKEVSSTTQDKLRDALIEGVNAGEGVDQLSARVATVFDQAADYRTNAIARTEVIGAANEGALEAYKQGGVESKGWLAEVDERTRETHIAAGEKYGERGIPLNEDFEVGGDTMPAPGQGSDPAETVNCRCAIIPIVDIPTE